MDLHLYIAFPVYQLLKVLQNTCNIHHAKCQPTHQERHSMHALTHHWNSHPEQFSVQYQFEPWIEPTFRLVVDQLYHLSHSQPPVSHFDSQRETFQIKIAQLTKFLLHEQCQCGRNTERVREREWIKRLDSTSSGVSLVLGKLH